MHIPALCYPYITVSLYHTGSGCNRLCYTVSAVGSGTFQEELPEPEPVIGNRDRLRVVTNYQGDCKSASLLRVGYYGHAIDSKYYFVVM